MRVFLGITGASGAPYAARLLRQVGAGLVVARCLDQLGIENDVARRWGE